jgi:hypothetical protein
VLGGAFVLNLLIPLSKMDMFFRGLCDANSADCSLIPTISRISSRNHNDSDISVLQFPKSWVKPNSEETDG